MRRGGFGCESAERRPGPGDRRGRRAAQWPGGAGGGVRSAYGLRQAEVGAAARLRAAGHEVIMPGLHDGQAASTTNGALALMDAVGWPVICARARRALREVPGTAVLAGLSMGAGVTGSVRGQRDRSAGIVLPHAIVRAPMPTV